MPCITRPPVRGQSGFTLLEVLVAFVLTAIGIVALLQAFAGGLRNLGKMDEYVQAALVAESRLAEVGILYPVAEGEMDGVEEGRKYHWHIGITPYEDPNGIVVPPDELSDQLHTLGSANLYLVEVDVSWQTGRNPGHFQLHSLRAGP
jgi:general secretion pathway protein I